MENLYNNLKNSQMISNLHLEYPHSHCQDWELEVSDSNRIFEFIDYFDTHSLKDFEKYFLIYVILESYNDYLSFNKNQNIETKIREYLKDNFEICKDIIEEYCCNDDGENLEDCFLITPLIRDINEEYYGKSN